MKFVLIDETLVSHGYWVKVGGISLDQFRKNPVMYWMHQRPSSWDGKNQVLPIGKWENIKEEEINGIKAITADAVLDEKDEFAQKIKSKIEGGFIKMASVGLIAKEWSDAEEDLKLGQSQATITRSELIEASIVDIGANKNAVRLYSDDGLVTLSEPVGININHNLKKKTTQMKRIAIVLKMEEDSSIEEIESKIKEVLKDKEAAEARIIVLTHQRKMQLLSDKYINETNKSVFEKLADTDIELAEQTLKILKEQKPDQSVRLSSIVKTGHKETPQKWDDYTEEQRIHLSENNSEEYNRIYKEKYPKVKIK